MEEGFILDGVSVYRKVIIIIIIIRYDQKYIELMTCAGHLYNGFL